MDILLDNVTNKVMAELEKTQKDFWNISRKTGVLLNMFVKMMNAQNALEIGTSNGYSGLWLAKALKETGGHLTTIEFYEKRQVLAIENFKTCGVNDIITSIQGSACEVIKNFSDDIKFDFVFIDASKREYIDYLKLVKPHMTKKSMLVADNIISHAEKVKDFVEEIDNDNQFQYEIVDVPAGILVAYRGWKLPLNQASKVCVSKTLMYKC